MPILIVLAAIIIFLCVFGMRGLKIAAAVLGVAFGGVLVVALVALVLTNTDAYKAKQERVAAFHAQCPLCGPMPDNFEIPAQAQPPQPPQPPAPVLNPNVRNADGTVVGPCHPPRLPLTPGEPIHHVRLLKVPPVPASCGP